MPDLQIANDVAPTKKLTLFSRKSNKGKKDVLLFSAIFFLKSVLIFKFFFYFYFLILYILTPHAEEICAYVHKIIIIR